MTLSRQPLRLVENVDRRVIGAFHLVDAVTRVPLGPAGHAEARRVTLPGEAGPVRLPDGAVRIVQNRRGIHVVFRAPLFDRYVNTFDSPQQAAGTAANPVRLHLNVDGGAQYLPQEFQLAIPRSLDPSEADSVFEPEAVEMLRAPGASVQDGWAVLRVRVTQAGVSPERPLPAVLIRAFRSPRASADGPIGAGMTDWRGGVRGEAIVPVTGIQRFRPGSGQNVIETDQPIEIEATRDTAFLGDAGQFPDVPRLFAGTGDGIVRPPARPPGSQLQVVRPATPIRVQAGRELVVHLAMP